MVTKFLGHIVLETDNHQLDTHQDLNDKDHFLLLCQVSKLPLKLNLA